MISESNYLSGFSHFKPEIIVCNNEMELINKFIEMVINLDPEIICGYEVSLVNTI